MGFFFQNPIGEIVEREVVVQQQLACTTPLTEILRGAITTSSRPGCKANSAFEQWLAAQRSVAAVPQRVAEKIFHRHKHLVLLLSAKQLPKRQAHNPDIPFSASNLDMPQLLARHIGLVMPR